MTQNQDIQDIIKNMNMIRCIDIHIFTEVHLTTRKPGYSVYFSDDGSLLLEC
mgnify:FL=1